MVNHRTAPATKTGMCDEGVQLVMDAIAKADTHARHCPRCLILWLGFKLVLRPHAKRMGLNL